MEVGSGKVRTMAGKRKSGKKCRSTTEREAETANKDAEAAPSPEATRSGSGSPEPNCAICLGKLENKSFTDSCFHMFCFACLLEWSKVKAECPLCKQAFKSIIHNVRSNQDYDQYHLKQEATVSPDSRFRYRTTLTTDRWMFRQQLEQQRQLRMLQRPTSHTVRSQWRRMRQAATSAFRQRVYTQEMWVRDLSHPPNRPPRYRNISVAFFKRNPAASHRLVPWLNRELNVLLHNREDHVQFVLELIMDLVKRFDIQSAEFLEHIRSFMNRRSEHFVHEFYNFARSPYDMVAYDSHAVYDEPEPHVHSIESDSSSDNDDVIVVSTTEGNRQDSQEHSYSNPEPPNVDAAVPGLSPLLNRVRDFLAFIDTSQIGGWDSPLPGPSSLRWSPTTVPISEIIDDSDQPSSSRVDSRSTSQRVTVEVSPSNSHSDDDDDVMIVGFEEAWDRRTPIRLSSDEESMSPKTKPKKHKKDSNKEKKKSKSRKRRSRSISSERHSSQARSTRSRSRERHHHQSSHRRYEWVSSEERASTSRAIPKHFRFPSDSPPSRKRSRRSMSSEVSGKSSGRRRSRSAEKRHGSRSSRSERDRRRDESPSPRTLSSSPEYCGSYKNSGERYKSERSSTKYKRSHKGRRSRSRDSSVESGRSKSHRTDRSELLRKRHRHRSTSSVETLYQVSEKSGSPEKRHKKHKHKKSKKHKKHKSKDKEKRSRPDGDSSSGVEIVEIISEDSSSGISSDHSDNHQWKKHPTGHKKSGKSKSSKLNKSSSHSSTTSGVVSVDVSSPSTSGNTGEASTTEAEGSSSSCDRSKWRPIGLINEEETEEVESTADATQKPTNDKDISKPNSSKCDSPQHVSKDSEDDQCLLNSIPNDNEAEMESCESDQKTCESDMQSCEADTKNCELDLKSCESDTKSCESDTKSCESDSKIIESELKDCESKIESCGSEEHGNNDKLTNNSDISKIIDDKELLEERERTLRANILNRLSKNLNIDSSSSAH